MDTRTTNSIPEIFIIIIITCLAKQRRVSFQFIDHEFSVLARCYWWQAYRHSIVFVHPTLGHLRDHVGWCSRPILLTYRLSIILVLPTSFPSAFLWFFCHLSFKLSLCSQMTLFSFHDQRKMFPHSNICSAFIVPLLAVVVTWVWRSWGLH